MKKTSREIRPDWLASAMKHSFSSCVVCIQSLKLQALRLAPAGFVGFSDKGEPTCKSRSLFISPAARLLHPHPPSFFFNPKWPLLGHD